MLAEGVSARVLELVASLRVDPRDDHLGEANDPAGVVRLPAGHVPEQPFFERGNVAHVVAEQAHEPARVTEIGQVLRFQRFAPRRGIVGVSLAGARHASRPPARIASSCASTASPSRST